MDHTNQIPKEATEWVEYYNKRFGDGAASEVILTKDEIDSINLNITEKSDAVFDMKYRGTSRNGAEIRSMIERYKIPASATSHRDGRIISAEERAQTLSNRNLDKISETVQPKTAVITSRCSLRGFPTDIEFHAPGDKYYNLIEETELIAGLPVLVLHESADGKFSFVESYYYRGWVNSEFIGYCDAEEYELYRNPEKYVTVSSKKISVSDAVLDMGARLPYVSEDKDSFYVYLPVQGNLRTVVAVSKTDAVFGSLPLTMENYYAQAFKFLGTDYGWGGSNGNVDCSGFVCAVFRSFGIYLPRNTGDQSRTHVCSDLSSKGHGEIFSRFMGISSPAPIYWPGHVMLFLGVKDNVTYIIHAPTGGSKVSVSALYDLSAMTSIAEFRSNPNR